MEKATKNVNNLSVNNSSAEKKHAPFFQPTFAMNKPDAAARMPVPLANQDSFFKPAGKSILRKCAHCEQEEKMLHRKESSAGEVGGNSQLDNYVSSLSTTGQTLSAGSRQFFEPRFGHDFSKVRIHTDSGAARSAQSINALAYTTGNNMVFNSGQYSPETSSGQRLMAHELTHVVQQGATKQSIQKADAGPSDGGLPPGGVPENVPPPRPIPDQSNKICGPKIDAPLKRVLDEVSTEFAGWDADKQKANCDALTSLFHIHNEWDIEHLHLAGIIPAAIGCGIPEMGEDKNVCSLTVEVDGKCYLAGTVNYALWGRACRLCNDKMGHPSHATMSNLSAIYNVVGIDDPGPPGAWAETGWNGFTGTAPDNPNRPTCKTTCPTVSKGPFSWQWLPTHKGFNY
ncbi:eCIS core domain-containing protein [Mucilaginibacter mallensis]|nr:DUF4157 domain-containing protein [Mucilaginibacter mallensis]